MIEKTKKFPEQKKRRKKVSKKFPNFREQNTEKEFLNFREQRKRMEILNISENREEEKLQRNFQISENRIQKRIFKFQQNRGWKFSNFEFRNFPISKISKFPNSSAKKEKKKKERGEKQRVVCYKHGMRNRKGWNRCRVRVTRGDIDNRYLVGGQHLSMPLSASHRGVIPVRDVV